MRSVTAITSLVFVAQELALSRGAQDSINKLVDKLADELAIRAHDSRGKVVNRRQADLDHTMLGKLGHFATMPLTNPRVPHHSAHLHATRSDSASPGISYRLQFREDATPGQSHWVGYPAPLRRYANKGRNTKVSALGSMFHLDALPVDLAALSLLCKLPSECLAWYDNQALTFPLVTKSITSGVCYSLGDLCAQGIKGKKHFNFQNWKSRKVRSHWTHWYWPFGSLLAQLP